MPESATLRVHLLGGFRVVVNDCPVSPSAWRQKAAAGLVKLLALSPGYRLHREQAIEAFWPDLDLDAQTNNLNVAASRARQALAAAGAPPATFMTRDGEMLSLGPADAIWLDVAAYEDALACAWHTHDPDTFRRALDLYGGDLLPDDLYADWTAGRRIALRTSYLTLMSRLAELYEQHDELRRAIEILQKLVATEPTHEEAHVALMRVYALTGQKRQALAQYERLVTILDQELDTEPDRTARDLAGAILEGRFPDAVQPSEITPISSSAELVRVRASLPTPVSELIGREREIAEIQYMLATSQSVTLSATGSFENVSTRMRPCNFDDHDLLPTRSAPSIGFEVRFEDLLRIPLFHSVDVDLVRFVNQPENVHFYHGGQIIFSEGDPADRAAILLSGEVRIDANGRFLVVRRSPEVIGEQALINDTVRNATVRAISAVKVLTLPRAAVDELIKDGAFARNLLRVVSTKLTELAVDLTYRCDTDRTPHGSNASMNTLACSPMVLNEPL